MDNNANEKIIKYVLVYWLFKECRDHGKKIAEEDRQMVDDDDESLSLFNQSLQNAMTPFRKFVRERKEKIKVGSFEWGGRWRQCTHGTEMMVPKNFKPMMEKPEKV